MAKPNHKDSKDDEVLALMKSKPRVGFTMLFAAYYEEVCRHVYRYIPNQKIVEDIAQELFSELWVKRDTLNISSSAGAYLHRMAVTRSLNYIRDNKKRSHESDDALITVQSSSQTPDQKIEVDQLSTAMTTAIDLLPERCKQVFLLSRFEHLKNAEIASTLEISIKTVENQMTRALKALRKALTEYENDNRG